MLSQETDTKPIDGLIVQREEWSYDANDNRLSWELLFNYPTDKARRETYQYHYQP